MSSFGAAPPAAQDQEILNELLTTRYFQARVAQTSPLGAYLRQHPPTGWGPTSLLSKIKSPTSLDDRIAAALGPKAVISTPKGDHVLEVTYDAPTPQLAQATLQAIIAQFRIQRGALKQDTLDAARKQVQEASAAVIAARTNLTRYLDEHPNTSNAAGTQIAQLTFSARDAISRLGQVTQSMNDATLAVSSTGLQSTTLKVVDEPQLPIAPSAGKKALLKTVAAGAFGGAVISALGIAFVARRRRRALDVAEAEDDEAESDATNGSHPAARPRVKAHLEYAD
jgi:hypothetical protein